MVPGFGAVGQFAVGSTVDAGGPVAPPVTAPSPIYSGEQWVQRTVAEYAKGFNDLLPTGPAWDRDPASPLQLTVTGLAQIWGDYTEAQAALLLNTESDPRATNILLPDWETAFGLPDLCLPAQPTDIPTRQTNLVTKMTFLGAQSRQFFLNQSFFNYGQQTRVREYSPYQCGISGCGDTRNIEPDGLGSYRWGLGNVTIRFFWTVNVIALNPSWTGADLFCLFNRWKPAHTDVVFDYSALQELRGSRPWNSGYYSLF